jgi:hypothetical protein
LAYLASLARPEPQARRAGIFPAKIVIVVYAYGRRVWTIAAMNSRAPHLESSSPSAPALTAVSSAMPVLLPASLRLLDPLTGLANRPGLEQHVVMSRLGSRRLAVLVIGIAGLARFDRDQASTLPGAILKSLAQQLQVLVGASRRPTRLKRRPADCCKTCTACYWSDCRRRRYTSASASRSTARPVTSVMPCWRGRSWLCVKP